VPAHSNALGRPHMWVPASHVRMTITDVILLDWLLQLVCHVCGPVDGSVVGDALVAL
jgi:hypothetical protein